MDTKQDLPTFDHSAADFKEVGPRRAYMEQYFRALGLRNQVEEIRAQELEERCAKLREKRNKKVSQLYFEYALDYGVWYNLLSIGNLSQEDHPWPHELTAKPDRKDFSDGSSWYYQDWLRRNGPLPKSKGKSSKAPKSKPSASGASDVLRLSKEAYVGKAAIKAGKRWDEMHGRNATGSLSNETQPAEVAETTQKSPAAAKDTVARYDPSIPFALQIKRAAATENSQKSPKAKKVRYDPSIPFALQAKRAAAANAACQSS